MNANIEIGGKKINVKFYKSTVHKEVMAAARGKKTITVFRNGKEFGAFIYDEKGEQVWADHPAKAFAKAVNKFWH